MRATTRLLTLLNSGAPSLEAQILATEPIAYWPLSDTVGSSTAVELVNGLICTASNVTFGVDSGISGRTAASFNGSTSVIDVSPTALTAFFNGSAGTLLAYVNISNAVWTDTATRIIAHFGVTSQNRVYIEKAGTPSYRFNWNYIANNVTDSVSTTIGSGFVDTWVAVALTWDFAADEMFAYFEGLQSGTEQNGLGEWQDGTLVNTLCAIGGLRSSSPALQFSGVARDVALWDRALAPTEIAVVSNKPP